MDSPEWRAASLVRSPLRHLGGPREDPRTPVVDVNVRWTSTEQWGRNRGGGKGEKGSDPFLFELDVLVGTVRPRPDTTDCGVLSVLSLRLQRRTVPDGRDWFVMD